MSDRPMSQRKLDKALWDAAKEGDAVEAERVIALKANVNYRVCCCCVSDRLTMAYDCGGR